MRTVYSSLIIQNNPNNNEMLQKILVVFANLRY